MPVYHLMQGIEHEEDNSVSASMVSPIDYGPTFDDAFDSLREMVCFKGNKLQRIDGGLFKHLPGVEGVFVESDDKLKHSSVVWLIKALTN